PLWLVASEIAEPAAAARFGAAGAQVIRVPPQAAPSALEPPAVLRALAERGISRLMIEGGSRVASSFMASGLVDEIWLLRGPGEIGADGIAALDALPLTAITQSPAYRVRASETLDHDTLTIYERV
ncbi:MAG: dihydrofolate reductase family protein, partial [Bradyrhizobium sp.]